jgi:hypothetical protein
MAEGKLGRLARDGISEADMEDGVNRFSIEDGGKKV